MEEKRNLRKTRTGVVVSDKMDKTVVVAIKERVKHPLYGKIVNRTKKFKVHDENNQCGVGDKVRVMETRPLSKDKHWRVIEIVEKAKSGGSHDTTGNQIEGGGQLRRQRDKVHQGTWRLLPQVG